MDNSNIPSSKRLVGVARSNRVSQQREINIIYFSPALCDNYLEISSLGKSRESEEDIEIYNTAT